MVLTMNIQVNQIKNYDYIAIWKKIPVTVNGKASTWKYNVNKRLNEFGKIPQERKGTWSLEKQEAYKGDY